MILNANAKYTAVLSALLLSYSAQSMEVTGLAGVEYRYFQHESLNPEPTQHDVSFVLAPEFYHQWQEGKQSLIISPYLRIDSEDDERTHFDLREAKWLYAQDDWELNIGLAKVYWGVTESQHLVDVINQTDAVENSDGEDKLGQPMLNLSLFKDWGTIDLFVLPYFRERTFAGKKGRLRSPLVVDTNTASYQSSAKQHHIDVAIRWSHSLGDWDFGLSHFYGTNREPLLQPNISFTALNPYYEIMHQTGIELQNTHDAWLWKLEFIRRETDLKTFTAVTGGLEYTFYGVFESDIDVGVIAEYLFDDRNNASVTPFENDVMLGTRLAWNDEQSTELLLGIIQDLDTDDRMWNVEASRRIGDRWKLSLEGRFFSIKQTQSALYSVRNDDHIQLELVRYF